MTATVFILPPRCTCGMLLGSRQVDYETLLEQVGFSEACDRIGFHRMCCRMRIKTAQQWFIRDMTAQAVYDAIGISRQGVSCEPYSLPEDPPKLIRRIPNF